MSIIAPDRSIPKDILPRILEIEKKAYVQLRIGKYPQAEQLFHEELKIIVKKQESEDRPIHKGTPLHMIGLCLLYQEKIEDSFEYFLLAYIEDTLKVGFELESEADLAPASLMLRTVFKINIQFLKKIKVFVADLKIRGKWERARNPEGILSAVRPRKLISLAQVIPKIIPKTPIDPAPGTWDKRVFIGGDYDHLAILREIQAAVLQSGFQPILPYDFLVPPNLIHHHDLMLLHCCRLGIFEVSSPAGQLMEIERANDYDVDIILFYSDRDGPPHSLSSMVSTAGYAMEPYSDIPDLTKKVRDWLATK